MQAARSAGPARAELTVPHCQDPQHRRVIGGSDLNAGKARVALAVAMGVDPSIDGVRAWFKELG